MSRFVPTQSFARFRRSGRRGGSDPFHLRVQSSSVPENPRGELVLYWMQSARRLESNLALELALHEANLRRLPLVVYESLRPDYPGANERIHTFVLEGVAANRAAAETRGLRYLFFLPRTVEEARGKLYALASRARLVVTDEFPTGIIRQQTANFLRSTKVRTILVDGNGILPMRAMPKEQYSARFFRDRAHRSFDDMWASPPRSEPVVEPFTTGLDHPEYDGDDPRAAAAGCEIDHSIKPVSRLGGRDAALNRLDQFVVGKLKGYSDSSRSADGSSGLSPYIHFGFLSIHEIADRVLQSDAADHEVDAFLEQLIIRRELSFNLCFFREDHDQLAALPEWAARTLEAHRRDRREPLYDAATLERGATGDDVWNLAQQGLLRTGTMHNYLRMLWGKKIIEWSETPEEAHRLMLDMHERYALDGRDPNTHAGVLWCFGKHDRPWFPERPIFGTVRIMSSESTRKKVDLRSYAEAMRKA